MLRAEEVDIYANDINKKDELIRANSDVLVFSNSYFISANEAIYNENSKDLELFGDVNILRNDKDRSNSCYAKLNLNTNESYFKNFFFANSDMEVWLKSEESSMNDDFFRGKNSLVSSCNVENPDWSIGFSEGEFDRDDKYLHLYHAKFYVKDVPIFYTPYLGFSADTSRRSGLLIPIFEINQDDGLHYEQPIYIALQDEWDLQLNPQLRTSRGFGMYSTLRFMDSQYSSGEFSFGAFLENKYYYLKENLKNRSHKGLEFKYHRDNLFIDWFDLGSSLQEGMWLDLIYLNDVDYLNLGRRDYRDLTSLATSTFSYFLADENNYYASYANYYIDTSLISNSTTLQEYPSFQYHRFLNGFFDNTFQYSFDADFNRYYRDVGVGASLMNFNLPLIYHQKLFDDLLNFEFSEELDLVLADYTNAPATLKKQEYLLRNAHNFSLYTELSKPYSDFYHTLYIGFDYFLLGARSGAINVDFIQVPVDVSSFNTKMVQYFYNQKGEKKIKHRLNISYNSETFSPLAFNNMLAYFFNENISISNEVEYSYEQDRFTKSLTYLDLNLKDLRFAFSHAYKYDTQQINTTNIFPKYSFIGARADYNINSNYKLISSIFFDTQRANINSWELGYSFQRKCWNYSLTYRERIDPQLTSGGIKANSKSGIYFTFNLYPIGGVAYDFAVQENESMVGTL